MTRDRELFYHVTILLFWRHYSRSWQTSSIKIQTGKILGFAGPRGLCWSSSSLPWQHKSSHCLKWALSGVFTSQTPANTVHRVLSSPSRELRVRNEKKMSSLGKWKNGEKMRDQPEEKTVNSTLDMMNSKWRWPLHLWTLFQVFDLHNVSLHLNSIEYSHRYLLNSPLPLLKALSPLDRKPNPVSPPTVLNNTTILVTRPPPKSSLSHYEFSPVPYAHNQWPGPLPKYFSYPPSTLFTYHVLSVYYVLCFSHQC